MEKTSIRGVERVTGHHRDTVSRYYHLIGEHAEILNECYLRDIAPGRVELDELWTFVKKKTKTVKILGKRGSEIFGFILRLKAIQGC
jgi:hypothetical protein